MAVQSFSIEINAITMYKFRQLSTGIKILPDKNNSLNIMPQVHEISVYESIYDPIIRCELAIYDYIGLFVNFPMTGEEIIVVDYKNVGDQTDRKWIFAIDSIEDITPDDKNKAVGFIVNGVSIEGLANSLNTVQRAFTGTTTQIAKKILEDHITARVEKFYPSYQSPNVYAEDNDTQTSTIVIPNMRPLAAIDMVQTLSVSEVSDKYTYLFYQNARGFNFRTLQGLTRANNARRFARKNKYIYYSDEIAERESKMNNNVQIISNLSFNKRHSSIQKIATGYFNNNLFEVNIAQKAYFATRNKLSDIVTIENNPLNTKEYATWADSAIEGDEVSNRTRYSITTRAEHDKDFPIYRARDRWGKDLISKIALAQVDLNVVIPGTNRFVAGDLFYLEIPEFHGFEKIEQDDLVSGYYLITEVKQVIRIGGFQSTVLRIHKDSFNSSVDRPSKY